MPTKQDSANWGQNLLASIDKIGGVIKERRESKMVNKILSKTDVNDVNSVGNASTMLIGMGKGTIAQGLTSYYGAVENDKNNKLKREMFKHQNKYEYDVLVQNQDPRVVPFTLVDSEETDALGRKIQKKEFGEAIQYDELVDYSQLSPGKDGSGKQPYKVDTFQTNEGVFQRTFDKATGYMKIERLGDLPVKQSVNHNTSVIVDATPEYENFYYKEGTEEHYVRIDRQSNDAYLDGKKISQDQLVNKNLRKIEPDSPKR